jgi:hypothetical protein
LFLDSGKEPVLLFLEVLYNQTELVVEGVVALELLVFQRGLELEVFNFGFSRNDVSLELLDLEIENEFVLLQLLGTSLKLVDVLLL